MECVLRGQFLPGSSFAMMNKKTCSLFFGRVVPVQCLSKVPAWGLFLVLIVGMALQGCGRPGTQDGGYPASGHMTLLSMEEAGEVYKEGNLITNGGFSSWSEGAPAPEGFTAPTSKIVNILKRESRGGEGDFSVDQYWSKDDRNVPFLESFHCLVESVQSGRVYELAVDARSYDDTTVSLYVLALDESGKIVAYWPDLIKISPGQGTMQTCTARIRPDRSCTLAIVPRTNSETRYRARILWLGWRLTEVPVVLDAKALPPQPFSG